MDIKFLNQPKETKLSEILNKKLMAGFDEVYLIAGMAKDSGFEIIYDNIKQGTQNGSKVQIFTGIDRKNISKDMLLKLLSINCKVHVHINTESDKVETRIYMFESKNNDSYIYITGAKFSEGGLEGNSCTISEIKYSKEEKKNYETAKHSILQGITQDFHAVTEDEIVLLAEKGEIVARITDRKIPKITEMYGGNSEQSLGEQIYDEGGSTLNIDFDEFEDIDIDIDQNIVVRENVELEIEREQKREKKEKEEILENIALKGTSIDKLYEKTKNNNEEKTKPTIRLSGTPDFKNMTTLVIESNKIIEKGVGAGEVKIPKKLSENLTDFFKDADKSEFYVLDNKNNEEEKDETIEIKKTEKGISILSEKMIQAAIAEGDILRVVKMTDGKYRCEIIRKESKEYDIWICFCTNSIRGQKRRYGII